MKIWLLLSSWGGGGLERVQANLAAALCEQGDDVELVAGRVDPVCRVESGLVPMFNLGAKGVLDFIPRLIRLVEKRRPQVVMTTSNDVACLLLMLKILGVVKVRVVVTQHLSISGPRRKARGVKRLKLEVIRLAMRIFLPYASEVIAVSEGVRLDMRRELGLKRNIEVIHNPIITPIFFKKMEEIGDWPWLDRAYPTIIWVGRLAPEKRLDLLVDAFYLMRRRVLARLLIVGGGSQKAEVQGHVDAAELGDCCKIVDFTSNPLPLIRESQVLVLCSDYEGFGNVLVEAMACGVNVVATDCPYGPSDILGEGRWGRLVAVGDVQGLAQALQAALTEPMLPAGKLRERARDFSIESALQRYRDIIRV